MLLMQIKCCRGHEAEVLRVQWSEDGNTLATGETLTSMHLGRAPPPVLYTYYTDCLYRAHKARCSCAWCCVQQLLPLQPSQCCCCNDHDDPDHSNGFTLHHSCTSQQLHPEEPWYRVPPSQPFTMPHHAPPSHLTSHRTSSRLMQAQQMAS